MIMYENLSKFLQESEATGKSLKGVRQAWAGHTSLGRSAKPHMLDLGLYGVQPEGKASRQHSGNQQQQGHTAKGSEL